MFICYKETDAHGRRTQDSVLANDLYHQLTNEGFKVFFSRITLEDKLGVAYEPYIFAALNSAKVMVVLGTRAEHFNAVWVKNEWSRYLALIRGGAKKTLIPAYRDMDPYDLPEEFSHLQAQDMSKLGFMQDLIRGIKKIAQTEEPKPIAVQEAAAPVGNSAAVQLLKRGNMALEDGDWARADEFFEQALNADAELADAYLGKFFAEQEAENADAFVSARLNEAKAADAVKKVVSSVNECIDALAAAYRVEHYLEAAEIKARFKDFDNSYFSTLEAIQELFREAEELFASDRLLLRTKQFGSSAVVKMKEQVLGGLQQLLDEARQKDARSIERIQQQFEPVYEEQERWAATEKTTRIEKVYSLAIASREEKNFVRAGQLFESLGDYKDSVVQTEQCCELQKAKVARQAKKTKLIVVLVASCVAIAVAVFFLVTKVVIPASQYKKAVSLMEAEQYRGAIVIFEDLGEYKDSANFLAECWYESAESAFNAKEYKDAIYAFNQAGYYEDAADRILECWYAYADLNLASGDYKGAIDAFKKAGSYQDAAERINQIVQDDIQLSLYAAEVGDTITFGKYARPIEWTVLSKDDKRLLVITKEPLTEKKFEDEFGDGYTSWGACTLYRWLNGQFLNSAFNAEEKSMLLDIYGKVFILSAEEVKSYMPSLSEREFGKKWWTRTLVDRIGISGRKYADAVVIIDDNGAIYSDGYSIDYSGIYVRPALWISISN